jgi:hypothetical protein
MYCEFYIRNLPGTKRNSIQVYLLQQVSKTVRHSVLLRDFVGWPTSRLFNKSLGLHCAESCFVEMLDLRRKVVGGGSSPLSIACCALQTGDAVRSPPSKWHMAYSVVKLASTDCCSSIELISKTLRKSLGLHCAESCFVEMLDLRRKVVGGGSSPLSIACCALQTGDAVRMLSSLLPSKWRMGLGETVDNRNRFNK